MSSVNVIIGNTAQIYCFHPEEVAADNNLYVIVEFLPAKEDNSKYRKIVKYKVCCFSSLSVSVAQQHSLFSMRSCMLWKHLYKM